MGNKNKPIKTMEEREAEWDRKDAELESYCKFNSIEDRIGFTDGEFNLDDQESKFFEDQIYDRLMDDRESENQKELRAAEYLSPVGAKARQKYLDSLLSNHQRRAAKFGKPISLNEWQKVLDFYNGRCAYCKTNRYEHMEHVVPLSKGGVHDISNLVPACADCNQAKGSETTWHVDRRHPGMDS